MLTQTTRRHLQVGGGEYKEAANRDCIRDKFILVPVPFPIPAITAIAFRVVPDMIPRWVGALVKGFDRPVYILSRYARSQGVGLPTLVLNKRAYQGQAMASSPITEVLSQIDFFAGRSRIRESADSLQVYSDERCTEVPVFWFLTWLRLRQLPGIGNHQTIGLSFLEGSDGV